MVSGIGSHFIWEQACGCKWTPVTHAYRYNTASGTMYGPLFPQCFNAFAQNYIFMQLGYRRRPYRVEYTGSLLTSEVKRRRARLVLGWGTAREDLRVLSAFFFLFFSCKEISKRQRFALLSSHEKGSRERNSPSRTLSQNTYGSLYSRRSLCPT